MQFESFHWLSHHGLCIGNHTVSNSIWNYFAPSEFFKKLKLHEPLRRVQFQLFEKLTNANSFQIEREKPYDYLLIIQT